MKLIICTLHFISSALLTQLYGFTHPVKLRLLYDTSVILVLTLFHVQSNAKFALSEFQHFSLVGYLWCHTHDLKVVSLFAHTFLRGAEVHELLACSFEWREGDGVAGYFHMVFWISSHEYCNINSEYTSLRPGADQSSKAAFCKSTFAKSQLTFGKIAFARSRFAFRQSIFASQKQWSGQVQRAKYFLLKCAKACSKAFLLFARLVCAMSYL